MYSSKDAQSGNEVSGMKMLVLSDSHGNVENMARSGAGAARPHRPLGRRYARRREAARSVPSNPLGSGAGQLRPGRF